MKKISFLTSVFLLFLTLSLLFFNFKDIKKTNTSLASDIDLSIQDDNTDILECLKEFATLYKNRTAGTAGCDLAAEYIIDAFLLNGLEPYEIKNKDAINQKGEMEFSFDYGNNSLKTKNIVYVKKANEINVGTKTVVIGAHYDNSYDLENEKEAEGVFDNAGGVATLIILAKYLQNVSLPFDLVFVAFSGEEFGFLGSNYYLASLSLKEKLDIMLMINLDSFLGGDYLYMYIDEYKRTHGDYLFEKIEELSLDIRPIEESPIILYRDEDSIIPYSRPVLMSDHYPFFNAGINIVSFLGGNLSIKNTFSIQESNKNPNILNTSRDTLETYLEYYGATGYKKGNQVIRLLINSFPDDNFINKMEESYATKKSYAIFNDNTVYILVHALFIILIFVFAYLAYVKIANKNKRDKDDSDTKKVKSEDIIVFEEFGI